MPSTTSAGRRLRGVLLAVVAALATVVAGAVTAVPAHAAQGGVTGVVTYAHNNAAVTSGTVTLHHIPAPGVGGSTWSRSIGSDGTFAFDDVTPGSYTLSFDFTLAPKQFRGGVVDIEDAIPFTVADGATPHVESALSSGVEVSGHLVSPTGDALVGHSVQLYRYVGGNYLPVASAASDGDGRFAFRVIGTGDPYTVRADGGGVRVTRYYGGSLTEAEAEKFTVGGTDVSGLTIVMEPASKVEGVVRDKDGAPHQSVSVLLHRWETDSWDFDELVQVRSGSTGVDGRFSFNGLLAGTYTLRFVAPGATYPDQWLGAVTAKGGAQTFTVGVGETESIDIRLTQQPFVAPAKVAVSVPKSSRFGTAVRATVTVTANKGTPAGTVTLRDGATVLGTKQVAGGKAVFDLPATLAVGTHRLSASFATIGDVQSGDSPAAVLEVGKATASVTAKLKKKKKARLKVTVRSAVAATGKVVLRRGKKTVATKSLKNATATFKLKKLGSGKKKLRVDYAGSPTVEAATKKVTVRLA